MTAYPRCTLEVAFPSKPLATDPYYIDLSSRLLSGNTDRALRRAGTGGFVLDNSDGALNQWNTASPYYGNLLTINQSSVETDTTGFAAGTNCGISRTTARALDGSASLLMSSAAAGTMSATTEGYRPTVYPGNTYTGMAHFSRNAPQRNVRVSIRWYNVTTLLSTSVGSSVLEDAGTLYVHAEVTAVCPANANRADLLVEVLSTSGASEQHYVDQFGLHGGAVLPWTLGTADGLGGLIQPMNKLRFSAQWNLLTEQQSSIEAPGTVGFVVGSNCTLSRTTARALDGAASLLMQSVASGTMSATTETTRVVVTEGLRYTAMAHYSRNASERNVRVSIRWFNISTLLSTTVGGTVAEPASAAYIHAEVTGTAPAGANRADILLEVLSTGAANEQHYVDELGFFEAEYFPSPGANVWSRGGPYYQLTGYVEEWGPEWEDINFGDIAVTVVDLSKALTLAKPAKPDYHDAVMADTPIGYYTLDDSGVASAVNGLITAEDSSGNNRDATYKGSPEFQQTSALPSEAGYAVGLKRGDRASIGTNSENWGAFVEVPITVSPPSGTGNFSIEAWVNPKSIGQYTTGVPVDRIWELFVVGGQVAILSIQATGKLKFFVTDGTNGGTLDASTALTVGRWNHVVAVKSGTTGPGNWKLYLNGVDVSTGASTVGTGNVSMTTNSGLIGGYEIAGVSQGSFEGLIDEVAIYNTALSSARVTAHYNAGHGLVAPALTGTRVGQLLDIIGAPAADRSLDAGQFMMAPITEPIYNTPPYGLFDLLIESEGWPAQWFCDGRGFLVFQDRAHATPASSATFSDASSTLYYDKGPGPVRSDRIGLWPAVVLERNDGKQQAVRDAAAADKFIERTLTRTGLLNDNDADVATMAATELTRWKTARDRIERLVVHPIDEPGTMYPQVLGRELNDRITVERTDNPGDGAYFSGDFRISGIGHVFDGQDWLCTWQLEPT